MNFTQFDYEFDLNGYVVLKNLFSKKVDKINKLLQNLENKKNNELPHNIFGKLKISQNVISQIF